MKSIIFISISTLLFFGCSNGVPSCESQINSYESCALRQLDTFPCDLIGSARAGQVFGNKVRSYCGNVHLAPNFQDKCTEAHSEWVPNFMKKVIEQGIDKCM